eukprot:1686400-Lingulodinium_polyedra.AAC.1
MMQHCFAPLAVLARGSAGITKQSNRATGQGQPSNAGVAQTRARATADMGVASVPFHMQCARYTGLQNGRARIRAQIAFESCAPV